MSVRTRWDTVRRAVRGNRRGRQFWSTRPKNRFTADGYEVVEDFLDRDECQRLVALAEHHLAGPGHLVAGTCYTWVKSEAEHGRNQGVREILNIDDLDERVAALLRSRTIQDLFAERIGEPVELLGASVQFDGIDTSTKRGFHVDGFFPPQFKAFVYLTDVEETGDGPYTVIPGSHRSFGRKLVNDVANALTTGSRRDMRRWIRSSRSLPLLAPAGTLILSTQDMIHKGWSDHWRRPRYALIAYGTTRRHFRGGPLTEGIEFLAGPTAAA